MTENKTQDVPLFQKECRDNLGFQDKTAYPKNSTELCKLFQNSNPPKKAYDIIVLDPPWKRNAGKVKKIRRYDGKVITYPGLSKEDIMSLPISRVAKENALIWIWVAPSKDRQIRNGESFLEMAFACLRFWGFEFCNLLTWDTGKNLGAYGPYSMRGEFVLFGRRGTVVFSKEHMQSLKTCFQAPSGIYSEKPRAFYDNIRRCFPGERLDIFGSGGQAGFDEWGYEFCHVVGRSHYVSKPGGFYSKAKTRDKETEGLFSFERESL